MKFILIFIVIISLSSCSDIPIHDSSTAKQSSTIFLPIISKKNDKPVLVSSLAFIKDLAYPRPEYDYKSTDLGIPLLLGNKLYLFFGDSKRYYDEKEDLYRNSYGYLPYPGGFPSKVPELEFVAKDKKYLVPEFGNGIDLTPLEVPTGGFVVNNRAYIFYSDDYCFDDFDGKRKITMGRSFLSRYDGNNSFNLVHQNQNKSDGKGTFSKIYNLAPTDRDCVKATGSSPLKNGKFINIAASVTKAKYLTPGNTSERDVVVLFGSGSWRRSSPYLSIVETHEVENKSKYRYWNHKAAWTYNEADATPLFNDSGIGEFSAFYVPTLNHWIMVYNDHKNLGKGGKPNIVYRTAKKAVGPWSEKKILLESGSSEYNFLTNSVVYAPYIVEPYIQAKGSVTDIYFVLSVWASNYKVVLMKASFSI